jgi:hypothetical protein
MRISLDPKIFPISLDTEPPILYFFSFSREFDPVGEERIKNSFRHVYLCTLFVPGQPVSDLLIGSTTHAMRARPGGSNVTGIDSHLQETGDAFFKR